ncbi:hypothetical protein Aazo_5254 (plasmid) ['Nostoc azollae' 0708]|jgi:hypothetical protein|uniref:Uncharacterized protein n=1 Tax=Nostoc azollae (strain 0708) TaxID=551115 RepID=D7E5K9_NOSA0|nr:hypothetical protein Aazo_5254 ['Nostoc azollae' 0708]
MRLHGLENLLFYPSLSVFMGGQLFLKFYSIQLYINLLQILEVF